METRTKDGVYFFLSFAGKIYLLIRYLHDNNKYQSQGRNLLKMLIQPVSWNFISKLAGTPSKLAPCSDNWSFLFELFLTLRRDVSCSQDSEHQFRRNVWSWNEKWRDFLYKIYRLWSQSCLCIYFDCGCCEDVWSDRREIVVREVQRGQARGQVWGQTSQDKTGLKTW